MGVSLLFFAIFVAIFWLNFMPKSVRNSIFGLEITSPTLNVVQVFFGIPQAKLPTALIPCFLLILFIGFCHIFRTCYQSKSFELMTSDVRKPPPNTIQDLINRNYTILSCANGHELILEEILADEKNRYFVVLCMKGVRRSSKKGYEGFKDILNKVFLISGQQQ